MSADEAESSAVPSDSHAPPRNTENRERPSYTMYENDNLLKGFQAQNLNHITSEGFLAFVRLCVKAASLWLKEHHEDFVRKLQKNEAAVDFFESHVDIPSMAEDMSEDKLKSDETQLKWLLVLSYFLDVSIDIYSLVDGVGDEKRLQLEEKTSAAFRRPHELEVDKRRVRSLFVAMPDIYAVVSSEDEKTLTVHGPSIMDKNDNSYVLVPQMGWAAGFVWSCVNLQPRLLDPATVPVGPPCMESCNSSVHARSQEFDSHKIEEVRASFTDEHSTSIFRRGPYKLVSVDNVPCRSYANVELVKSGQQVFQGEKVRYGDNVWTVRTTLTGKHITSTHHYIVLERSNTGSISSGDTLALVLIPEKNKELPFRPLQPRQLAAQSELDAMENCSLDDNEVLRTFFKDNIAKAKKVVVEKAPDSSGAATPGRPKRTGTHAAQPVTVAKKPHLAEEHSEVQSPDRASADLAKLQGKHNKLLKDHKDLQATFKAMEAEVKALKKVLKGESCSKNDKKVKVVAAQTASELKTLNSELEQLRGQLTQSQARENALCKLLERSPPNPESPVVPHTALGMHDVANTVVAIAGALKPDLSGLAEIVKASTSHLAPQTPPQALQWPQQQLGPVQASRMGMGMGMGMAMGWQQHQLQGGMGMGMGMGGLQMGMSGMGMGMDWQNPQLGYMNWQQQVGSPQGQGQIQGQRGMNGNY